MRNYPALKCYTSKTQYEMLKELQGNPSISNIITKGRSSSKTLGSIFRSRWVAEREYTDDKGVVRTGWFLTTDGENAVTVYEQVEERKKREEAEQTRLVEEFAEKYAKSIELEIQWRNLKQQADTLEKEAELIICPKFGHGVLWQLKCRMRSNAGLDVPSRYYTHADHEYYSSRKRSAHIVKRSDCPF